MTAPDLESIVPHRAPMLVLDTLEQCDEKHARCLRAVRPTDLFVEGTSVSSLLALELFAQAAAAHFGYLLSQAGGGMAAGALLGTRRIKLYVASFEVGDVLEVNVLQVMQMPPAAQYECTLMRGQSLVAEGTVNVALGRAT